MKILIVDDDKNTRDTLRARLEAFGFETETAEDPLQAVVRHVSFLPDVTITDCDMGETSGLQLTAKLRKLGVTTPIIMFSGSESAKEVFETIAGGTKFFSKSDLMGLLHYVTELQL